MNINQIVNDPELWAEYCKAYAIAAHYRPAVQFRLAIINSPHTHVWDDCIFTDLFTPGALITAIGDGWVSDDLKGPQ
jgi:hypothetical protein